MWHVSSRSGEASRELLYSVYFTLLYFTLLAQTVLGVYLKRTCSRVTSASSALGVLNDYAQYKYTHSLTCSWHSTA